MIDLRVDDFVRLIRSGMAEEELSALLAAPPLVVVTIDRLVEPWEVSELRVGMRSVPALLVAVDASGIPDQPALRLFDAASADADSVAALNGGMACLRAATSTTPLAAVSLAILLRHSREIPAEAGLAIESATYSMLQSGPEFMRWRAAAGAGSRRDPDGPEIAAHREGSVLRIELNRPEIHNAYSVRMRDQLNGALSVALADPSIERILISGRGPSFCSGGYLPDFGTLPDPTTAHLIRLTRNAARALNRKRHLTEVWIHGATVGAGIELAAFAGRVIAHPDVRISLPEVGMGLIPGAGGTVSLPRRIGAQRTLRLALSGRSIDSRTALRWGLIDEIRSDRPW